MTICESLHTGLARRELLRLGVLAGIGAAFAPRLAFAASDPSLTPKVDAMIARWVGPGKFPGIVASFGLPGHDPQFTARGSDGFNDPDAMTPDSLFRIYSMTKPVTGMAAMVLVGEGKLKLDQPVSDILPKFANMQVQVTPDGSITELKPAKTSITIRQLITHTSGLGYSIIQRGPLRAAYEDKGLVPGLFSRTQVAGLFRGVPVNSLELFADRLADMPLVYEPGTRWSYSVGLDLMGRVIEVVSGKAFDQFLKERIFDPCGMNSTFFQVPQSEAGRLTTNHAAVGNILVPIDTGKESVYLDKPPFPFGGAGLVSSARDYDRFLRMLAQHGTIGGHRVIGEQAVRIGTANLLPAGVQGPAMMGPASDFGAGGRVGIGAESGLFGWAGAAGTVAGVDMKRGIRMGLYLQFTPPNALPVLGEYQEALRQDLMALMAAA